MTSIATRPTDGLYGTISDTISDTITRALTRGTDQSLNARLDRDIARLRAQNKVLREILAEEDDDDDHVPYRLVRATSFAVGTWVEERQGMRGKVVSRRGQQGIVSVADIDQIWGVGDPPLPADAWADARPIEADGSPWLGASQAQPLVCHGRLQPVSHVLREHWFSSARERHWVCVAALYGAELARSRPERAQRVRRDLTRMQWTVEVDSLDDGPPIVIHLGDEDVRAWAEAHGFSAAAGEVLLPT